MKQPVGYRMTGRARAMFRALILLLSTFVADENAFAGPRRFLFWREESLASTAHSTGYLAIVGPAPLRFASASALPESARAEPVSRASSPTLLREPEPAAAIESPAPVPAARPEDPVSVEVAPPPLKQRPPEKPPAPIALDDLRPIVRAEDFLPYFQLPSSGKPAGELVLIVPSPRAAPPAPPIPPSSATYTQTPK